MFEDLYPVAVEAGWRHYPKARVFHRDGTVRMFVDAGRDVQLVREGDLLTAEQTTGRRWVMTVDTVEGRETWDARRVSGCGCGSRLKLFTAERAWST